MFPGFSLEFKKYGLGIAEAEWLEFVCVDGLFASMDAIEGPWGSDTI